MSPKSQIPLTILGVLIATVVSFLIASPIIRMSDGKSLEDAQDDMAAKKAESKGITVDWERRKTQIKLRRSYLHVTQEWDHLQWELQNSEIV